MTEKKEQKSAVHAERAFEELLRRVKAAQAEFATYSQEKVDEIFKAAATSANAARIPLAEIAKKGVKFAPGEKWGILAARYNYSHFMYRRQTSSFPVLPAVNFHLRQYYAPVIFR